MKPLSNIHCHFVGSEISGDSLEELRGLEWDQGLVMCARHAWAWPLYCRFRMRGANATFGYGLEKNAINFIHAQTARHLLAPADLGNYFIVAMRADYRAFPYTQFEVVQNMRSAGGTRVYMPHLPQPGLIPREENRKEVVHVCFSGQANNFCVERRRLEVDLAKIGCRLVIRECGEWHDMHDVDILLGIRSFDRRAYDSKPPTKLFNAWLAGIPFIGGFDSAYGQVATPGKDFLRVRSYEGLIDAVARLKQDDGFYRQLVENGRMRGKDFTADRITDRWMEWIEGDVAPAFGKWKNGETGGFFDRHCRRGFYALDRMYHLARGLRR